ncbi:MAG: DNA2/NAM7 family helicase [Archaeoglobaceae archaeon]|nr:DNA2/NAM7 family helicase [Archaeoglobaceae archaeon]MDW8128074.1 AAA domain-containing protein [Archaeoglobaceae archaeon]
MNLTELLEKIEKAIERKIREKDVYDAEVLARKGEIAILFSSGQIPTGSAVAWVEKDITPFGWVIDVRKTKRGYILAVKEFESFDGERIVEAENLLSIALRKEIVGKMDEVLDFGYWSGVKKVQAPEWLDKWQRECFSASCSLEEGEILLVIGPPGTGKTTFIAESAKKLSEMERVWITSNTNIAVDNVLEKLNKALRIGHPSKLTENVKKHSVESKILSAITFSNYEELARKINSAYREIAKIQEEMLNSGKIAVGSTILKGAMSPIRNYEFDTVFIDEASNTCISLALLALEKAKKAVVVGDPYQLPPVYEINVPNAVKFSAFNYLYELFGKSLWLRRHYRCNAEIIAFSAKEVYKKLEIDPRCFEVKIPRVETSIPELGDPEKPVLFLDCNGEEKKVGASKINELEAEIACEICDELVEAVGEEEIGIITPYLKQKELIKSILSDFGINCEVATVHSYQGREKEVIVYSITATNNLFFASDKKIFNVALTRAKAKFIALGNSKSIEGKNFLLSRFLDYAKQKGGYVSARKVF